jgi:hypothetical protein
MYSNSKNQISLEEAYRQVHLEKKYEEQECGCKGKCKCDDKKWCDECNKPSSKCECEKDEVHEDFGTAHNIIANNHNTREEIIKFLPEVFGAATLALAWGHREASEMISMLMSKLNIGKIEQVLSPLEQEKQALESKAKHNMEAQSELNAKIDEILKEGSLEALEQLYKADGHNIPITKLLKALEEKLKERVNSRK